MHELSDADAIAAEKEAGEIAQKVIMLLDSIDNRLSTKVIALAMVSATLIKTFEVITEGKANAKESYEKYGDLVGSYLTSMKAIVMDSETTH